MELIDKAQVAEILGVTETRVDRMTRESLLTAIPQDDGSSKYDKGAIERYKSFADKLGGI